MTGADNQADSSTKSYRQIGNWSSHITACLMRTFETGSPNQNTLIEVRLLAYDAYPWDTRDCRRRYIRAHKSGTQWK